MAKRDLHTHFSCENLAGLQAIASLGCNDASQEDIGLIVSDRIVQDLWRLGDALLALERRVADIEKGLRSLEYAQRPTGAKDQGVRSQAPPDPALPD